MLCSLTGSFVPWCLRCRTPSVKDLIAFYNDKRASIHYLLTEGCFLLDEFYRANRHFLVEIEQVSRSQSRVLEREEKIASRDKIRLVENTLTQDKLHIS